MDTAVAATDEAIVSAYRSFQKLTKRELLCQYRSEIGAITPKAAYRHALIGGLMRRRFGDDCAEVLRQHR